MAIHLQSVEQFKDVMTINVDVDAKTIKTVLYNTQLVQIQSLLGTDLYKKIIELVETGDITLPANAAYKTLLDEHIKVCLRFEGYSRLIPHLNNQLTDKGQQSRNGEFSQPSGDAILMKRAKNDAELMAKLMMEFICDNIGDYPEYNTGQEGILPNDKPYFSGVELDYSYSRTKFEPGRS